MAYYDQDFVNRMFEAFETYSFMPRHDNETTQQQD
jgi:hypothetical protein